MKKAAIYNYLKLNFLVSILLAVAGCGKLEKYQNFKLCQFENSHNYIGIAMPLSSDIRKSMGKIDEMKSFVFWCQDGENGIIEIIGFVSFACFSEDKSEIFVFNHDGIRGYSIEHTRFRWILKKDGCYFSFPDVNNDCSRAVINMSDLEGNNYIVGINLGNSDSCIMPVEEISYVDFISDHTVFVDTDDALVLVKFAEDGSCEFCEEFDNAGQRIILGESGEKYVFMKQQYNEGNSIVSWMNQRVTITPKVYSSSYTSNGEIWLLGEKGDVYIIDSAGNLSKMASIESDRIGYGINKYGFWVADSQGTVFQIDKSQKKIEIDLAVKIKPAM